ncbi:MAG: flagellar type III secretion system pore protein FliP [Nitrospinae bacterium]|nr:flagellar type III secretion system pore protein FliP [Nitrospinota bacterium]
MEVIVNKEFLKIFLKAAALLVILLIIPSNVYAEGFSLPSLNVEMKGSSNPDDVALSLQVLMLLTVLSLAPAILIMTTSFARIVVVLAFLRQAMGTQSMPPNQIVIGLALFLTFFIMAPVFSDINSNALQPYLDKKMTQADALKKAMDPLKMFMIKQTREKDLALFMRIGNHPKPRNVDDLPLTVVIPSFIISELKTGFQIGFLIYVPFLILDMVVASVLMSMGMMMLPPVMISLPFKLMLFVLVDGWYLIVGSLVRSYGG